jgi:hypothetical protein
MEDLLLDTKPNQQHGPDQPSQTLDKEECKPPNTDSLNQSIRGLAYVLIVYDLFHFTPPDRFSNGLLYS